MKKYKLSILALLLFNTTLLAQIDSSKKLSFSAYAEFYYSYDFSKPSNHEKQNFLYNHKRHNEVNANLILAKINYTDNNTRANLALMAGNYAQYNLSAEPVWAQFINEVNVGVRLSKKKNIWLDVGIMPSHIGFESAISADCYTLTRSLQSENSPYFETGAKLSYSNKNEKLNFAFLFLNGWQRIQKPNNIQAPSFGMQVNYKVNDNTVINYSNFIGTDKPDSVKALRTYHNFYCLLQASKKVNIIAGMDIGTDKNSLDEYGTWFSPVLIVKYKVSDKTNIALRSEYFDDEKQLVINTNTVNGFKTLGLSSNIDYQINNKVQCRIEGKYYKSKDGIFKDGSNNNLSITTNLTIKL
jgi:Putative beta-barrel porin-2, OmpL-like. bbp2